MRSQRPVPQGGDDWDGGADDELREFDELVGLLRRPALGALPGDLISQPLPHQVGYRGFGWLCHAAPF